MININEMKEIRPKRKRTKKDAPSGKPINELLGLEKSGDKKIDKKTPPTLVIADSTMLDEETTAAIRHALQHYLPIAEEKFKTRQMIKRDLDLLESVISEYLKTFVVLGYDLSGEKIQIMHANNPQEFDSMLEHVRGSLLTILIKAQQNLPGMPGSTPY